VLWFVGLIFSVSYEQAGMIDLQIGLLTLRILGGQLQPDFLSLLNAAMTPSLSGSSSGLRFLGEGFWVSTLVFCGGGGGLLAVVVKVSAKASSSSSY
jgi:hypothetical protein